MALIATDERVISIVTSPVAKEFWVKNVEDEMTAALRGETLKEIGYLAMAVWLVVRVAMTFASDYIPSITHDDSTLAPFIIWALYYGRFERKMKALRQQSREFKL